MQVVGFFFKRFYLFPEREGNEKERERNVDWLPLHAPPTGDLACNTGMCPDWELNRQFFGSQAGTQPWLELSHTNQGSIQVLIHITYLTGEPSRHRPRAAVRWPNPGGAEHPGLIQTCFLNVLGFSTFHSPKHVRLCHNRSHILHLLGKGGSNILCGRESEQKLNGEPGIPFCSQFSFVKTLQIKKLNVGVRRDVGVA